MTTTEIEPRVLDAITAVHEATCLVMVGRAKGSPYCLDHDPLTCISSVGPRAMTAALAVLNARPRDAAGARRALHDHVCASSICRDEPQAPYADEHAKRMTDRVVALRKWLAAQRVAA